MDEKFLYLTSKYLAGEITEAEREDLLAWVSQSEVNKADFEEMQRLWKLSGDVEEEFETDVAVAWEKVAKRTTRKDAKIIRYPWGRQLLRIAAVFFVFAGAYWLLNNRAQKTTEIVYQTGADEKSQIALPDGSKVWLNENTKITLSEKFEPRVLQLEGEAFFEVEHLTNDQLFEIISGDTKTIVLGTSFNVRAYPDEQIVEVAVETGKVAFEKTTEKEVEKILLNAGDSGLFDKVKRSINKETLQNPNANAWKTGQLTFENTGLREVKATLERYFDIKINASNEKILDCHFTGTYQKPELEQILEVLKFSLDIEIVKEQNQFTLSGEGCN